MKKLTDMARVIRSKNASPFELTLDIILERRQDYERLKAANLIRPEIVAALYRVPLADVKKVIYFDPAMAVKIVMRRPVSSGAPGDTDVYGAQQHAPLLGLEFDL